MKHTNMDKIFNITGVSRADIEGICYDGKIAQSFSDEDMKGIAFKMHDMYLECCYWIALEMIVDEIIEERKGETK